MTLRNTTRNSLSSLCKVTPLLFQFRTLLSAICSTCTVLTFWVSFHAESTLPITNACTSILFSGSGVNFYVIPRVCQTLKLMSLPKHLSTAPICVIPAAVLVSFSCCCLCLFSYTPPVCLPPTFGEALQENETCSLS